MRHMDWHSEILKYDHLNDTFCHLNILFKPIRAYFFHPGGYSALFEGFSIVYKAIL